MSSKEKRNASKDEDDILVVGLGASAGGIQALKDFFDSLPDDPGMAFIVVLHLAPEKDSTLDELLQARTNLEVQTVSGRIKIESDHVYVIPPDKMLSVEDNHLELSQPEKKHGRDTINLLFRTLADKKEKHAAGVLFSGTGSDGTVGMKRIKEKGGIAICQDPDEAQHPGMLQSAIQTGVVDKVLPVREIAAELHKYKENLFHVQTPDEVEGKDEEVLSEIFERIQSETGHDFNNYRRSSVLRRIDRRMRVNRVNTLSKYLSFIDKYPDEVKELYKDLLISVTDFFRDPEAFDALEKQVIPNLFENKNKDDQVRVWVPGCATGEEAYSVAMLLQEHIEETGKRLEIQVFASDVDEEALATARAGRYPKSISSDVSEQRLRRFFEENGEEYIVKQELRDLILFASHDLLSTPPFSRQDLVTCRNLLIYLNRDLQSEVFSLFHYALRPSGWLFLGKSDSSLGTEDLFKTISKEFRIYRQKPSAHPRTPLPDMPLLYKKNRAPSRPKAATPTQRKGNIEKMHLNILTRLYAPQSVLVDEHYSVIHSTSKINKFLEYGGGEPSRDILDMVKPGLRQPLRSILFQLQEEETVPVQKKVQLTFDENKLELSAHKFSDDNFPEGLIHVVFKEVPESTGSGSVKDKISDKDISGDEEEMIESLERELEYTKEQLHLSVEEYETSNEELRASNEELQSMNEELQSTTEELETSKEELQSVNEELETVNDELEGKVAELRQAHSDLENLMEATEVGIIFVDRDLQVKRFTSTSTGIFNLIPSDEGRPLEHITHSLVYDSIMDDVRQVLEKLEKIKKVVHSKDDRWFIMRLRPYRSTENKIEGVVITFTEFTELKEARDTIRHQDFQEVLATLGVYALERRDLQMIMQRAIDLSCIILDLNCAVILSLDKEKNHFKMGAHAGCASKREPLPVDEKWDIGYTLKKNKPVVVTDYENDDRFTISPFLKNSGIKSGVNVEIRGTNDTFGIFSLYSDRADNFNRDDLNFIQIVANIVGMVIERNNVWKALEEKNERLNEETKRSKEYQKEIINNSLIERWELGGYLHDNLAQLLASAKITASDVTQTLSERDTDLAEKMKQIVRIIDESIAGIRDLTHDIIPIDIEEEGVEHAFRFLMRQTQKIHNTNCTLETDEIIHKIKNRKLATHLYHIVQEAIKNAVTHGKAEKVKVSIYESDGKLVLKIEDGGLGKEEFFDNDKNGKGLRIMEHRMDLLGGTFQFSECGEDSDFEGMAVVCTVPVEELTKEK